MVIPNITRRAFMKGIAALAGKSAIPKTVSKAMEAVTPSSVNVDSAPWIQNMVGSLKNIVDNRKLEALLPNGAEVRYVKAPANEFDSHSLPRPRPPMSDVFITDRLSSREKLMKTMTVVCGG